MSSHRWIRLVLLIGFVSAAPAQTFTCPASIMVSESATPQPPWTAEPSAPTAHAFLRPSIFNGTPGKQEYDLAPDNETTKGKQVSQSWNLKDYRADGLFVRCRYAGTAAALSSPIPASLKTCTFSFRNTPGNRPLTAPVFECR